MPSRSEPPTFIEGRVVHKKSNALEIAFYDGPGEPIAVRLQGPSFLASKTMEPAHIA
jgi:hypothetical protein